MERGSREQGGIGEVLSIEALSLFESYYTIRTEPDRIIGNLDSWFYCEVAYGRR